MKLYLVTIIIILLILTYLCFLQNDYEIEFFGNFKESTGITSFKGEVMPIKINLKEADANSKFDQLLKQFNSLVDLTDKPKDIKLKLEQIKETVKNSNLTPRQTDSIVDRVNFYLNNQYGKAKHSLILG
jgi:hypothetical protein